MDYPELHWDTLVVTGVTESNDHGSKVIVRWSMPLDQFLNECIFLKSKE